MATRDLTYLIDFNVQGAEDLTTAASNMEELADATNGIDDGTTRTLDIEVPETLATDIDEVGGAVDDLGPKMDTAGEKAGGLKGVLADFGLTSIGVGEAIDLASGALELGGQAWDAITDAANAAEAATKAFNEATSEVSGAIDTFRERVEETQDPLDVLAQAFIAGFDDEQIASTSAALGDMGLQVEDLGGAILGFAQSGDLTQTFLDMADAAGVSTEGLNAFQLGSSNVIDTMGETTAAQQEFIDGFNQIALGLNGVDFETVAARQLDVAEGFDAIGVAAARAEVGPDATDLAAWLTYTQNMIDAEAATEGAAAAAEDLSNTEVGLDVEPANAEVEELRENLEAAAAPRTAEVTAEADVDNAEDELDALPQSERIAVIDAQADVIAANADLLDAADEPRSALIVAHARTAGAEIDLAALADAQRTAEIDVVTGSINMPSPSQLVSLATGGQGRIVVPIVGRWSTRIEGSRPI